MGNSKKSSAEEVEAAKAAENLLARRRARKSLGAFVKYVHGFSPARHHQEWIDALEDESIRRLLIIAPPAHAKTNWISIFYPAWKLGSNLNLHFGLVSNTATQAYKPSVAVRDTLRYSPRYQELFPDIKPDFGKGWAENEWFLRRENQADKNPSFVATGVGGPILGDRLDEVLFDDMCDQENTSTKFQLDKVFDWARGTPLSRLGPDGRAICICTRWHEGDPAGRWMKDPKWKVIKMPAEGYYAPKEALWAAQWPLGKLQEKRVELGTWRYQGMYMGDPSMPAGNIFKRHWWRYHDAPPSNINDLVQIWDTAFKEDTSADYSVCHTWARSKGMFYLLDRIRDRMEWPALLRAAKAQYEKWQPRLCLIEEKASGISLLQALRYSTRMKVLGVKAETSKLARSTSISSLVEAQRVSLPRDAPWLEEYIREHAIFPNGEYDDEVDCTTHVLLYWTQGQEGTRVIVQQMPVVITPELDAVDGES